jgi:hypothetical protein
MSSALSAAVGRIRRTFSRVDAIVSELVTGVEFREGGNVEALNTLAARASTPHDEVILVCSLLWTEGLLEITTDKAGWSVLAVPADALGGGR